MDFSLWITNTIAPPSIGGSKTPSLPHRQAAGVATEIKRAVSDHRGYELISVIPASPLRAHADAGRHQASIIASAPPNAACASGGSGTILNCPLVVLSAPMKSPKQKALIVSAQAQPMSRRGEIDRRPVREGRRSARPLRYRSIMS